MKSNPYQSPNSGANRPKVRIDSNQQFERIRYLLKFDTVSLVIWSVIWVLSAIMAELMRQELTPNYRPPNEQIIFGVALPIILFGFGIWANSRYLFGLVRSARMIKLRLAVSAFLVVALFGSMVYDLQTKDTVDMSATIAFFVLGFASLVYYGFIFLAINKSHSKNKQRPNTE